MKRFFKHSIPFVIIFLWWLSMFADIADKTIPQRKAPDYDSLFAFKVAEQAGTDALKGVGFKNANVVITIYKEKKRYEILIAYREPLDKTRFYYAIGVMIGVTQGITTGLNKVGFGDWTLLNVFGTLDLTHEKTEEIITIHTTISGKNILICAGLPKETEEQKRTFWDFLWNHLKIQAID